MSVRADVEVWREEIQARLEAFCRERSYILYPNSEAMIRDLVSMRQLLGDFYCPCQPQNTPDTVCICLPVRQGLVDALGACFCHLVVRKEETWPEKA